MEGSCGCVLWGVSVAGAAPSYPEAVRRCGEESTLRRGVGDGEWGGLLAPDPRSAVHSLCEPGQVNQPLFALLSSPVNEDNKSTYLRVFVRIQ